MLIHCPHFASLLNKLYVKFYLFATLILGKERKYILINRLNFLNFDGNSKGKQPRNDDKVIQQLQDSLEFIQQVSECC